MFGAIAGGIASALAGGAMSKLFGGGQKAASGGIQGDVDRKSGSAGMPRPISYAVFCLKKKIKKIQAALKPFDQTPLNKSCEQYHLTHDLTPIRCVPALTEH